jgi:hypothetical protein
VINEKETESATTLRLIEEATRKKPHKFKRMPMDTLKIEGQQLLILEGTALLTFDL